jgi:hypothetical protein
MGLVSCTGDMCLGHESSGYIAQLGSNLAALAREAGPKAREAGPKASGEKKGAAKQVLRVGDRVTLEPGVTCRMCPDCRGGRYQVSLHAGSIAESKLMMRFANIWPLLHTRHSTEPYSDTTSCTSPITSITDCQTRRLGLSPPGLRRPSLRSYDGASISSSTRYSKRREATHERECPYFWSGTGRVISYGCSQGIGSWEDRRC